MFSTYTDYNHIWELTLSLDCADTGTAGNVHQSLFLFIIFQFRLKIWRYMESLYKIYYRGLLLYWMMIPITDKSRGYVDDTLISTLVLWCYKIVKNKVIGINWSEKGLTANEKKLTPLCFTEPHSPSTIFFDNRGSSHGVFIAVPRHGEKRAKSNLPSYWFL